jgi:hypothetical protein
MSLSWTSRSSLASLHVCPTRPRGQVTPLTSVHTDMRTIVTRVVRLAMTYDLRSRAGVVRYHSPSAHGCVTVNINKFLIPELNVVKLLCFFFLIPSIQYTLQRPRPPSPVFIHIRLSHEKSKNMTQPCGVVKPASPWQELA